MRRVPSWQRKSTELQRESQNREQSEQVAADLQRTEDSKKAALNKAYGNMGVRLSLPAFLCAYKTSVWPLRSISGVLSADGGKIISSATEEMNLVVAEHDQNAVTTPCRLPRGPMWKIAWMLSETPLVPWSFLEPTRESHSTQLLERSIGNCSSHFQYDATDHCIWLATREGATPPCQRRKSGTQWSQHCD